MIFVVNEMKVEDWDQVASGPLWRRYGSGSSTLLFYFTAETVFLRNTTRCYLPDIYPHLQYDAHFFLSFEENVIYLQFKNLRRWAFARRDAILGRI